MALNVEALRHASKMLHNLQQELEAKDKLESFNMAIWANECRTAGCFIGWAGVRGWFEQFGTKITFAPHSNLTTLLVPSVEIDGKVYPNGYGIGLKKLFCLETLAAVDLLVDPQSYPNGGLDTEPNDVAERIEYLIEHGEDRFSDRYTQLDDDDDDDDDE